MINLLATERKAEIAAARTNTIIVRYTGIIILAFLFLGGVLYVSHTLLQSTMANATSLIEAGSAQSRVYSQTKQQIDALGGHLTEARNVLGQEVQYSKVLTKIGQLTPDGVVLDSLKFTATSFSGSPTSVKAYARSTSEASSLQQQLESLPLFNSVVLQDTKSDGGIDGYPVVVTLTVSLNRTEV